MIDGLSGTDMRAGTAWADAAKWPADRLDQQGPRNFRRRWATAKQGSHAVLGSCWMLKEHLSLTR